MNELDQKINTHFPGKNVRKDLVKDIKNNTIVPSYVLEYLLGRHCATSEEAIIQTGVKTVKEILRMHYVSRKKATLMCSNIKENGCYKVIDKISVTLNEHDDVYEAIFSNLGIKKVLVSSRKIKAHPKLLVDGAWCIADIQYRASLDKKVSPWILSSLQLIQSSGFDFNGYVAAREHFTITEWIDLLIQSLGFNPAKFDKRTKLLMLVRLIPYCEPNYNLIELGPKSTGKSHTYSELSPNGILISGGALCVNVSETPTP